MLLIFPFAAVHDCVLLSTGVEEALCLGGNAGQPVVSQISGRCALPVSRPPISQENDLLLGFAPKEFQGGLPLVDLLSVPQPSCFFVVLLVLVSRGLACFCPLFWFSGKVVSFPHDPFTSTFTSNR